MTSDRLLSVLLLLQAHGRMTVADLAQRLEVSTRTILRDIDRLSAAGVPVYTERGRNGGCLLMPGYRTEATGLTASEARALFMFGGRGAAADLGMESDLRAALRKLLAAMPAPRRPEAIKAESRVVVDSRGWMRPEEALPRLVTLQEALWSDRRLRLTYRAAGRDESSVRTTDPYGLVSKAGTWYLIAAVDREPLLFRVSRVESAELLDEPARRPPGLDLEALWAELRGRVEDRGEGVEVRVRVKPEREAMLLRVLQSQFVRPALKDGADLLLFFPAEAAARGNLLGFGVDVEVLSPASLRSAMRSAAQEIARLYAP